MKFRSGVLHGEEVTELLNYANENDFALPAVNVVNTSSVNAVLQTAKDLNSPVIIQFSNGGALSTLENTLITKTRRPRSQDLSLVRTTCT